MGLYDKKTETTFNTAAAAVGDYTADGSKPTRDPDLRKAAIAALDDIVKIAEVIGALPELEEAKKLSAYAKTVFARENG